MHAAIYKKLISYLFLPLAGLALFLLFSSLFANSKSDGLHIPEVALAFWDDESIVSPEVLGAQTYRVEKQNKLGTFSSKFYNSNYRAYVFDMYFEKFDSPLVGHGQNFVDACESYGAPDDCLLMVAIAKAETNLCNTPGSDAQKNCWGFGGSGTNRIVWPNYETSINEVTRRVMEGYGTRFFNDANNGELFYCGAHCSKWGDVVNGYKAEINEFGVSLGFPSML